MVLPCELPVSPAGALHTPDQRNYPVLPTTCDPSSEFAFQLRWLILSGRATQMERRHAFGAIAPQVGFERRTLTRRSLQPIRNLPFQKSGLTAMNRTFRSTLFLTAACLAFPVAAQTPPTQAWPQNRPPAQAAPPAQPAQPAAPPSAGAAATPPAAGGALGAPAAVPLPQWFVDIDVEQEGRGHARRLPEVPDEVVRGARRQQGQQAVGRGVHQGRRAAGDPGRRARPAAARGAPHPRPRRVPEPRHQPRRLRRARRGRGAGPFRVQQLRHRPRQQDHRTRGSPDHPALDAARGRGAPAGRGTSPPGHDDPERVHRHAAAPGRRARQEQGHEDQQRRTIVVLAGPADGPQAKNLLPFDMRKQIAMRKFAEIDTNKDGQIDRVETDRLTR